ncbi:hypothetical protein CDAR_218871 [Caerostris darwini]|uniref:Uncharacterized protein n=1 Tax=Caerostris darwini TaxID=1538125 RepID=A0AAV4VPN0_9ARAC|nr:hypothetical protein CDAR_218871 [Caerostris darwini]
MNNTEDPRQGWLSGCAIANDCSCYARPYLGMRDHGSGTGETGKVGRLEDWRSLCLSSKKIAASHENLLFEGSFRDVRQDEQRREDLKERL